MSYFSIFLSSSLIAAQKWLSCGTFNIRGKKKVKICSHVCCCLFQKTVNLYPFQIHSIFLSSFASLIGPFGGFFASGFKRAFKIKVTFCVFFYFHKRPSCPPLNREVFGSRPPCCASAAGLCQHHPRTRRHHGSVRLPVPDGHLHARLHSQLRPVRAVMQKDRHANMYINKNKKTKYKHDIKCIFIFFSSIFLFFVIKIQKTSHAF